MQQEDKELRSVNELEFPTYQSYQNYREIFMKLHVAGVNHFDPLCREKLRKWLQGLSLINDEPPAFVAVEYDRQQFEQYKKQRGRFRQLLQTEWPSLSTAELDILENSLGYEGDTHLEIFPSAEVLWLDKGRQVSDLSMIDKYAEDRLTMYKQYSFGQKSLRIDQLSENIRKVENVQDINLDRSSKFANLICERVSKSGGKWAVVIVGYNHTRKDIQGSMRCLLENTKLICEVSKICGYTSFC